MLNQEGTLDRNIDCWSANSNNSNFVEQPVNEMNSINTIKAKSEVNDDNNIGNGLHVKNVLSNIPQSYVIKPHKYGTGGDICTFFDRFEHNVFMNKIIDSNLLSIKFSLVEDDVLLIQLKLKGR